MPFRSVCVAIRVVVDPGSADSALAPGLLSGARQPPGGLALRHWRLSRQRPAGRPEPLLRRIAAAPRLQYVSTAGSSVVLAPMRAAAVSAFRAVGRCLAAAARPKTGMLP
jgi:hypothetical protein